jgi:AGZA family xanthine/uracil permease-like MFS transporter
MVKSTLAASGATVNDELLGKLANEGVLFHGLEVLGSGAVLAGLVLAAITVFIIERQLWRAAAFAAAGAGLTFLGFMHGERIGFAESPAVAASYLVVALTLAALAKWAPPPPRPPEPAHAHAA